MLQWSRLEIGGSTSQSTVLPGLFVIIKFNKLRDRPSADTRVG